MQRLLLTASVMLAVLLYAIDTTVANVALPVLQGNLSATREQASWVLTSYLIASAVALPALAALESRLGLRRAFLLAIGGFGVASIGCGLAPNIESLVAARFLQGLCGAVLIPLGQTALQNVYPRELLARAFAVLGVGVMVGPVVGPWLGGWLTENFGWRSVFFVNVPFLLIALGGMWLTLRGEAATSPRPFDRLGFVLLAICLVGLQLAIDRGEQLDWFDSAEIVIEVFVAGVAGYMFIAHALTARNTLFSSQLLRNRNFMIGLLMAVCVGWPFMGAMVLLPQFLQEVQGYNVMGAGMLMAPRGLGLMIAMAVLGRYAGLLDPRRVLSLGALLSATGLLAFAYAPADAPASWLTLWLLVQGAGLGLIFVPINTVSFVTLAPTLRTEGAALMTLARNIGGSLSVALIVRGISQDVTANAQRLSSIAQVPPLQTEPNALAWLLSEIHREALVIAYSNQYVLLTLMPLLLLPLVWLTVMPRVGQSAAPPSIPRSSWWVRLLASLPMPVLHALATCLAWLAMHVFPYQPARIRDSLRIAFPQLDEVDIERLRAAHYRSFADVLVEIVKSAAIKGEDLDARMRFVNLDVLREPVRAGTPVLIVAAHQCNWEWILQGLARQLGVPLDAAYKPLVNAWADREMLALRSRFGARMVASGVLMRDMIARRRVPRVVALVADQEPVSSERRHWTHFLNRDTAFFMGPDVLVTAFGYPAFFVAIRRTGRGVYEVGFEPLWQPGEVLQPGEFTERYARRVEQQIRESPADWPWSYKRWRLSREAAPACRDGGDSAESAAP